MLMLGTEQVGRQQIGAPDWPDPDPGAFDEQCF